MPGRESQHVGVGKISGAFGVRGWVKLQSWMNPPEQILKCRPWLLQFAGGARECLVEEYREYGKHLIARLPEIVDRDQAAALAGTEIVVRRDQLPAVKPGEYYWVDLIGLEVRLAGGRVLGRVQSLLATGSNDVLVVTGERERLIPFIHGQVIKQVDLDAGLICVDWDPEF